ncbi:hypothetical protein JM98_00022 [Treponema putidum]|nr:hypothetical protein JM98_00022 [Treponema putidum]
MKLLIKALKFLTDFKYDNDKKDNNMQIKLIDFYIKNGLHNIEDYNIYCYGILK